MEKIFYFAQVFGALNIIATAAITVAALAMVILAIWYFSEGLYDPTEYDEDDARKCKKAFKTTAIICAVSLLVATFVPSKQTYLFMVGGNALEEIAKNEKVQERAGKAIDLLDQYLEKKLDNSGEEK
jgi:hypothetical protein